MLSIIVCAYNMQRELPRTLYTLQRDYQNLHAETLLEILVVDNGSQQPIAHDDVKRWHPDARLLRIAGSNPSPVEALNAALDLAKGDVIGVVIDGARMLSPGVLNGALDEIGTSPRAIVSPRAFHLGSCIQTRAELNGYNASVEDTVLESIDWRSDGYRLFEISVPAGGDGTGWYSHLLESTALFAHRDLWTEIEGFDNGFRSAAGGMFGKHTLNRMCQLDKSKPTILLGEATFHQFHGGVSTSRIKDGVMDAQFRLEYEQINGKTAVSASPITWSFRGDLLTFSRHMSKDVSRSSPYFTDTKLAIGASEITYRDGSELRLHDIIDNASDLSSESDELASEISDWPTMYHLSRLRRNILNPFRFERGARVLDIGAGTGAISRRLGELGCHVTALEGSLDRARLTAKRCRDLDNVHVICGTLQDVSNCEPFDAVVCVGVLEWVGTRQSDASEHLDFLTGLNALIRDGGALILAIENQIGLKYVFGYPEDHGLRAWSGIEGYPKRTSNGIRTFSRPELGRMLNRAGFENTSWYYPFPDYKHPRVILSHEAYTTMEPPEIDGLVRDPSYSHKLRERGRLVDERRAHVEFLAAGLGPDTSNSFLIFASKNSRDVVAHGDGRVSFESGLAWIDSNDRVSKWIRHRRVVRKADVLSTGSAALETQVFAERHRGDLLIVDTDLIEPSRSRSTNAEEDCLSQMRMPIEPYVRNVTIEQLVHRSWYDGDETYIDALALWHATLIAGRGESLEIDDSSVYPFGARRNSVSIRSDYLDSNIDNFVVDSSSSDSVAFVDTEWHTWYPLSFDQVRLRGLWYCIDRAHRRLSPVPWPRSFSHFDAMEFLAEKLSFGVDFAEMGLMLDSESRFQVAVMHGNDDEEKLVEVRRRLDDITFQRGLDRNLDSIAPRTALVRDNFDLRRAAASSDKLAREKTALQAEVKRLNRELQVEVKRLNRELDSQTDKLKLQVTVGQQRYERLRERRAVRLALSGADLYSKVFRTIGRSAR